MIQCLYDPSDDPSVQIDEADSKCENCCINCEDKDCEERCAFADIWKTENRILEECKFAEE